MHSTKTQASLQAGSKRTKIGRVMQEWQSACLSLLIADTNCWASCATSSALPAPCSRARLSLLTDLTAPELCLLLQDLHASHQYVVDCAERALHACCVARGYHTACAGSRSIATIDWECTAGAGLICQGSRLTWNFCKRLSALRMRCLPAILHTLMMRPPLLMRGVIASQTRLVP